MESGTIAVDKKLDVWERLRLIEQKYRALPLPKLKEVHIEQLPRKCHYFTHWSVGVIGSSLRYECLDINQDIPVTSWQRSTRWTQREEGLSKVEAYKGQVESEDELAAIAMGIYFYAERIENV